MCFPPSGMWPVSWFENHHHFFRCVSSSFAFLCFFFFLSFSMRRYGPKGRKDRLWGALVGGAAGNWTHAVDLQVLWLLRGGAMIPLLPEASPPFFFWLFGFLLSYFLFFLFLFWCYFSSFVFFSVSGVSAYCDGLAEENKKKCIFLKSEKKKKMMSTL